MKVVVLDALSLAEAFDFSELDKLFDEVSIYELTSREQTEQRIQNADVVLTNKVILDASVLSKAGQLKYIGILATGTNNIDLDYCEKNGILVKNAKNYSTKSVSQHTLMFILSLLRKQLQYEKSAKNWPSSPLFCIHKSPIEDIHNKLVGIYGFGDLGKATKSLLDALGVETVVIERAGRKDVRDGRMEFNKAISSVDILSVHCPLDSTNEKLFNKNVFSQMKKGSLFINTARGPLVDELDLKNYLDNGHLAGAALDVLSTEPPSSDNPLMNCSHPNLIITPHVAWASKEAIAILWEKTITQLKDFLKGKS